MVGLVVAAAAEPDACATVSAPDVPGSTAWTVATPETFTFVVSIRTWYLEAPVTTYGLVPAVAVAASGWSGPSPWAASSVCHRLQVAPVKVRIWYVSLAEVAPLGQVTPTTAVSYTHLTLPTK